jgi:hypothetical protein
MQVDRDIADEALKEMISKHESHSRCDFSGIRQKVDVEIWLSPKLVHEALSYKTPRIVLYKSRAGALLCPHSIKLDEICERVIAVRSQLVLWLNPKLYEASYQSPNSDERWTRFMTEINGCPRCNVWYLPGSKYCSDVVTCGIGLSDHAIHMELSLLATRAERLSLLEMWYCFKPKLVAKYMPQGASYQTTKIKTQSRLPLGNTWVAQKMKNAKKYGWFGHYHRFETSQEYRLSMISQGVGKFITYKDKNGNFDRFADEEYFAKHGIDAAAESYKENQVENLYDLLKGYPDDVYVPADEPTDDFVQAVPDVVPTILPTERIYTCKERI